MEKNRIYFSEGNPWPQGHAIKSLMLDARLYEGDFLLVKMYLESEDYNANDGGEFLDEEEFINNWSSKATWNNYHACSMGGTILSSEDGGVVSIDSIENSSLHIDSFPEAFEKANEDELSFNIYLLGHDDVADHRIEIGALNDDRYPIKWRGKIALAYSGEYDFNYDFSLTADLVTLQRVWYPEEWSDAEAKSCLAKCLKEHERFQLGTVDGRKAFVLG